MASAVSLATKSATPATSSKTKTSQAPSSAYQNIINNVKTNTANLEKKHNNNQTVINANRMMNATINDIAKKYGFDYSRDYAARQAEAEAQAKRNAYNSTKRDNVSANKDTLGQIDAGIKEGNQALDNSFFQAYLAQRQAQTNNGLNAGIAAEQDLRLGMNQQQQMASLYRDANLARNRENERFTNEDLRISEALSLVEQERLAQEDRLYQDLRQRAYENLMSERGMGLQISNSEWGKLQDRIAREYKIGDYRFDGVTQSFNQRMQEAQFKLQQDRFAWEKQQAAAAAAARAAAARASAARSSARSTSSSRGSSSSSLASAFKQSQKKSSSSNLDRYYQNQDRILKPNPPYRDHAVIPGKRITPATDKSLSAWEKMRMMF